MRRLVVALLVVFSVPAGAQVVQELVGPSMAEQPTQALLARYLDGTVAQRQRALGKLGESPVVARTLGSAEPGAKAADVTASLARELGVSVGEAGHLLRAVLLRADLNLAREQAGVAAPLVYDRKAEEEIQDGAMRALAATPDSDELHAVLPALLLGATEQTRRRLEAIVASTSDPVRTALAIAATFDRAELLAFAAERRPDDPGIWIALMSVRQDLSRVACAARGLAVAKDPDHRLVLAAARIKGLLSVGLLRDALAVLQSLPEGDRAAILRGRQARVHVPGLAPDSSVESPDLRLTIALACAAVGDRASAARVARPLLPAVEASTDGGLAAAGAAADPHLLRTWLLREALEPGDDAFDMLGAWTERWVRWDDEDVPAFVLAADVARRDAYPGFAAGFLRLVEWRLAGASRSARYEGPGDSLIRGDVEALRAAAEAARERVEGEREALERQAWARWGRDPLSGRLGTLLSRPAPATSWIHPLPPSLHRDRPDDATTARAERARCDELARQYPSLAGLRPSRVERAGSGLVAVGASEAIGGGWWLARSVGVSWDLLFTGLSTARFDVPSDSLLPLGDGPYHVEVRVDSKPNEFGSMLPSPRSMIDDLAVTLDPEKLSLDSDGDGLPDVVEDRLALDPNDPDTDGDGLSDGCDPLPQVVSSPPTSAAAQVVESVLRSELRRRLRAVPTSPANAPLTEATDAPCADGGVSAIPGAFFVTVPRSLVGSFRGTTRVIVLNPDEQRRQEERYGPSPTFEITLVELNHDQTKALVRWSWRTQTGWDRLTRTPDGWAFSESVISMS